MQEREDRKYETGAATHPGKVRAQNEDAYAVLPGTGVWAVSDGMGGHDSGELASSTIITALGSIESQSSAANLLARCEEHVLEANRRLKQLSDENSGRIIGATLALLLIHGTSYACVWAGDSRIYRVRNGNILQISRDHSEVQGLIDQGVLTPEEGRTWPHRSVITRAIGVSTDPGLEIERGVLADGDTFIICSDGLTAHVSDSEIRDQVASSRSQDACDDLVALSLQRGGTDNITVIVVRCHRKSPTLPRSGVTVIETWE